MEGDNENRPENQILIKKERRVQDTEKLQAALQDIHQTLVTMREGNLEQNSQREKLDLLQDMMKSMDQRLINSFYLMQKLSKGTMINRTAFMIFNIVLFFVNLCIFLCKMFDM